MLLMRYYVGQARAYLQRPRVPCLCCVNMLLGCAVRRYHCVILPPSVDAVGARGVTEGVRTFGFNVIHARSLVQLMLAAGTV